MTTEWEKENLNLFNEVTFQVTDPGPLRAPIHKITIRRDEELKLILESEAASNATSAAVNHPAGTLRISMAQVKLTNLGGIEALLRGVEPLEYRVLYRGAQPSEIRERALVHEATATLGDLGKAAYTIEWLGNLPARYFIWPDSIDTVTETRSTRGIARRSGGVTLSNFRKSEGGSNSAAKLTAAGQTFYICAPSRGDTDDEIEGGSIVYVGTPDEAFRQRVRVALSFALGIPLVALGHTIYDHEWWIVAATSRSAYDIAKRTFDPVPMPLAPLTSRGFQYDLGRAELTRMVIALIDHYDELDLGNLSWAYWHACTATVHIAPAHFGAAIEALQRAYVDGHPTQVKTKILDPAKSKQLREAMSRVIDSADIAAEWKKALKGNLRDINRVPQRTILKAVMNAIGIKLSSDEFAAWKRRNDAAHGRPVPEGEELAAIRDMKLLRGLFNRMLLRITNSADSYVDYVSLNNPHRRLKDPPAIGSK